MRKYAGLAGFVAGEGVASISMGSKPATSFGSIATRSGRSREHVRRECRAGLLPKSMLPTDPTPSGSAVYLPEDIADDLVRLFTHRVVSPSLSALMREDPDEMLRCLAALERLARLSQEEAARVPRLV